jgi:hypothetical protein
MVGENAHGAADMRVLVAGQQAVHGVPKRTFCLSRWRSCMCAQDHWRGSWRSGQPGIVASFLPLGAGRARGLAPFRGEFGAVVAAVPEAAAAGRGRCRPPARPSALGAFRRCASSSRWCGGRSVLGPAAGLRDRTARGSKAQAEQVRPVAVERTGSDWASDRQRWSPNSTRRLASASVFKAGQPAYRAAGCVDVR